MEAAGLAFGSICLISQLADACLSAYGLLQDVKSIGEDATHFHFLVTAQMTLLSLWVKTWVQPEVRSDPSASGRSAGKLLEGVSASIGGEGCLLVARILTKISKTLSDAETLRTSYGIYLSPTITEPLTHPQGGLSSESSILSNTQASTPQSLPKKEESPLVIVQPMSVDSRSMSKSGTSCTLSSSRMDIHRARAWFTRTSQRCSAFFRRHDNHHSRKPVSKQLAEPQTISSNTCHPTAAIPTSKLEIQLMDIGKNLSLLEETKTGVLNNLSKVRCLKWALFDKEKGLELARELEYWNDTLFKILPLKRVDPPEKVRISRHYTVPQSSPRFTGRAVELTRLEQAFFGQQVIPRQRRAVLYGLGGSGKTQIALGFAEKYAERFDSIFWINASSDNTVEESFQEIAMELKVNGHHLSSALKHHLSRLTEYNYLLIFDNADHLPTLTTYFPGGNHGNILVTSRNPRVRDILYEQNRHTIEVDRMSETDACELLIKAASLTAEETAKPVITATVNLIVERLGYLALAIDQAGSYIANTCSIEEFLALYDKMRPELMSSEEFQGSGYAASVYKTWELSFKAVSQIAPAAAELLMTLGYFHHEGIPREVFEFGSVVFLRANHAVLPSDLSHLGKLLVQCMVRCDSSGNEKSPSSIGAMSHTWVPYHFEQAMKALLSYSLVKRNRVEGSTRPPTYTIHPLVHCWIRDRHDPDRFQHQRAQNTAIALLQEAMLTDTCHGGYALRNRLVPHLDTWVRPYLDDPNIGKENWRILGHHEEEQIGVLEAAAGTYFDAGRLKDAEDLWEKVFQWRMKNLGATDPDTSRARVKLAEVYRRIGKLHKATTLDQESLETLRLLRGPEHPDTLQAMLDLGWTYAEAGNILGAERLERAVVAARAKIHGADSFEVALARGNLGVTLWRMHRFDEAEEELRVALDGKLKVYGREHPSTLLTLGNLASAVRGLKRWASAENLGREFFETRKALLGEKHQDVARSMSHLGVTYLEAGRAELAYGLQTKALEIIQEAVGEYHLHTLDAMEFLSKAMISLGREDEAVKVLKELVTRRKLVLPEAHPATLVAMKLLGGIRGEEELLKEVEEIERQKKEAQGNRAQENLEVPGIRLKLKHQNVDAEGTVTTAQEGIDLFLEERKKRQQELALVGLTTDKWSILV